MLRIVGYGKLEGTLRKVINNLSCVVLARVTEQLAISGKMSVMPLVPVPGTIVQAGYHQHCYLKTLNVVYGTIERVAVKGS